jgi:diphthamide synthase (EF-2-diphthine--ammonia ligase)
MSPVSSPLLNEAADRVAMHGVRRTLLEAQSAALGIPFGRFRCPGHAATRSTKRAWRRRRRAVADGFDTVAFGDLFLRDVREYRERTRRDRPRPHLPLWGIPTAQLARQMIAAGLRPGSPASIHASSMAFAGREFDARLLAVARRHRPCGENGEFHTFAYDGPMFTHPVEIVSGDVVERTGFVYADLLSAPAASGVCYPNA